MPETPNRVSDDAVKKATGKSWEELYLLLDMEGAKGKPHNEIARLLQDKGYVSSGWWAQMVTVEYERARGLRVVGQTAAAGYEVGARRSFPVSPKGAWDLLTSTEGLQIWLGAIARLNLKAGETYRTDEGITGEVRTLAPGQRVRLTWRPAHWEKPSTLQVSVVPTGTGAIIAFHQEQLASEQVREEMRLRWQEVLTQLRMLIEHHGVSRA